METKKNLESEQEKDSLLNEAQMEEISKAK